MKSLLIWCIVIGTLGCVLLRPKRIQEAFFACAGALLLVLSQLVPVHAALEAVMRGGDVYLFLTGMMLLSELARREGVFDWLAAGAVRAARGSPSRLFLLVYGTGVLVTTFLSNDATAVVLTPAVYAAVKRARATPLPYLLICAFVANAASFVLPISNPANLVVFGKEMPPLLQWIKTFALPSGLAIVITFGVLRFILSRHLKGELTGAVKAVRLSRAGRCAAWALAMTAGVLLFASARGMDLGLPTCLAAVAAVLIVAAFDRRVFSDVARSVSWSVLPLVAGLFVLVQGLHEAGALGHAHGLLVRTAGWTPESGAMTVAFGVALLSNIMNNLPVGVIAGTALHMSPISYLLRQALLLGIDLGPNLSVTGSLATLLWLVALRREGQDISAGAFFRVDCW